MATRILTATVALAIALVAILANNPLPFGVLLVLIAGVGAFELASLTGINKIAAIVVVLAVISAPVLLNLGPSNSTYAITGLWLLGSISLFIWKPNNKSLSYSSCFWLCAGILGAFVLQNQSIGSGAFVPNLLLLAVAPLWVGDSAAYFVGRAWGKHKLAPTVSPNKTVEGAVANLLGCLLAALAIGTWLSVPILASVAVGVSTGVLGQIGDLLQSSFKRRVNAKDSGGILPGHGGILDRLDSFLFSSVPTLLLLSAVSPELFHVKQWSL